MVKIFFFSSKLIMLNVLETERAVISSLRH